MVSNVAYPGSRLTIEFAIRDDGSVPALVFFHLLEVRKQARLYSLYRVLGDTGRIRNTEQFRRCADDFFELRALQVCMPCYFASDKRVVVTHGYIAVSGCRAKHHESERAKQIRCEYERRSRIDTKKGDATR